MLVSSYRSLYYRFRKYGRSRAQAISTSTVALCNALQRTATHCNTLQRTATHCNALQHTATYCNALQRTATHRGCRPAASALLTCWSLHIGLFCNIGLFNIGLLDTVGQLHRLFDFCCLQRTATLCNTLHHSAPQCNTDTTVHHTAPHCTIP